MEGDMVNNRLPDELLLHILGFLSPADTAAAMQACKPWWLLRRKSISSIRVTSSDPGECVHRAAPFLEQLRDVVVDERAKLRTLAAETHFFADRCLETLLRSCTQLETLTLIWCTRLTVAAGIRSSSLRVLRLDRCHLGDEAMEALGRSCALEELVLNVCDFVSDAGLAAITQGCMEVLKVLTISRCPRVTDAGLRAVGDSCAKLKKLSLDSEVFTSAGLLAVANGCPELRHLGLQPAREQDDALERLSPRLLTVELEDVADSTLIKVSKAKLQVTSLKLSSPHLTDYGLGAVVTSSSQLSILNLHHCTSITDHGLDEVSRYCSQLRELSLSHCSKVGDRGLEAIAKGCKQLDVLRLHMCEGVSSSSLVVIASSCLELKVLSLIGCPASELCFITIAENVKHLAELTVMSNSRFGDAAAVCIGKCCNRLKRVTLWNCPALSNAGVSAIKHGCKQLLELYVSNCYRVSSQLL